MIRAVSMQNSILVEITHGNGDRVKSLTWCQCHITYLLFQTTWVAHRCSGGVDCSTVCEGGVVACHISYWALHAAEAPHRPSCGVDSCRECAERAEAAPHSIFSVLSYRSNTWVEWWSSQCHGAWSGSSYTATFHIGPITAPKCHIGPAVEWRAAASVWREHSKGSIPYLALHGAEPICGHVHLPQILPPHL